MLKAVLDRFDHAILREVLRNNLTPARILSERVGISASAVQRRLKRMRDEKVIIADIAVVSPGVIGETLTVLAMVSIKPETSETIQAFSEKMGKLSAVKQCWYVTGDKDFVVVIQVADMESYADFASAQFLDDPTAEEYETLVVMRNVPK
jgi:Lrp/AsnC family transcriptional regulator, leucine-responsive regulatory protein